MSTKRQILMSIVTHINSKFIRCVECRRVLRAPHFECKRCNLQISFKIIKLDDFKVEKKGIHRHDKNTCR